MNRLWSGWSCLGPPVWIPGGLQCEILNFTRKSVLEKASVKAYLLHFKVQLPSRRRLLDAASKAGDTGSIWGGGNTSVHAWMQSRCNIWLNVLRNVGRCIGVHTTLLQNKYCSPNENLRGRPYAHTNTYCKTYICDIPIIPCIHPLINTHVESWVFAIHIIYKSSVHGLQVYRSTAKCLQTRSTHPYTCSIQLVYRGIQVYRSTVLQVYSLRIP